MRYVTVSVFTSELGLDRQWIVAVCRAHIVTIDAIKWPTLSD